MQGALMAFCKKKASDIWEDIKGAISGALESVKEFFTVLPVVGAIVITALCEFIERRRHH